MNWDKAIERNRETLLGFVSALLSLVAASRLGGRTGLMLPRRVWLAVLFVLQPAESAARRLILIAARALKPVMTKPRGAALGIIVRAGVPRQPVFGLFDPLRDVPNPFAGDDEDGTPGDPAFPNRPQAHPDAAMDASKLHQRLRALRRALADIARQARRLARWQGRRDAARKACVPVRQSPLRPGQPPGWRARAIHEVDPVLKECHRLAMDLANTS